MKFFIVFIIFFSSLFADTHSFILENDIFAGNDRHYTNGTFYTSMVDNVSLPWILDLTSMPDKNEAFTISQLMFTPKDISKSENIIEDCPYAGHVGLNWFLYQSNSNFLHNLGVGIGAVGPISLAKEAQIGVHKLKDVTIPKGWDNQLENKLTSSFTYQFVAKTKVISIGGIDFDWTSNIRFDFGDFYSGAEIGTVVRFGNHFAKNFPTTGGFTGGYESSMINMKKVNSLRWSISIGGYANEVENFYVIDEGIKKGYKVESIEYIVGDFASINIYYNKFELELLYKSAVVNEVKLNPQAVMENRGALNLKWRWD